MEHRQEAACEILVSSDIHGHIYPTDYRSTGECQLGLAKLATLIERERQAKPDLLLLDNGDLIQGTPLSTYFVKNKQGIHPTIEVLNRLGYDAAVPGNHEFNYGLSTFSQVVEDSHFPWLSAGITVKGAGKPAFGQPYITKVLENGLKLAVLGVTTHYIPHWENPQHIAGLEFADALETVRFWVPMIRREERPDLLIVAYHGGFERDLWTGEPVERLTGENQAYAMCAEVEGIDILITGHQHRSLFGEVNGVTIVQPSCLGQALGRINVNFRRGESGDWEITDRRADLLVPDELVEPDQEVLHLCRELEQETQTWLDEPIGAVDGDMSVLSSLDCRLEDHPFIEFVNRVQMEVSGAEASNTALLNEQSLGFQGGITRRDVLANFIYPNTLTVLRLTGKDIRAALEQTATYWQLGSDGELMINPSFLEPKAQHYNYDMWEGIEYELDISRPAGERVVKLNYNGAALTDEAEMDVVMNSYRAGGGGDYEMYQGRPVVKEITIDMADLVSDYIMEHQVIQASCNYNWRVSIQQGARA